jgi:hypothetical protein
VSERRSQKSEVRSIITERRGIEEYEPRERLVNLIKEEIVAIGYEIEDYVCL